jgi:hypothetical protein
MALLNLSQVTKALTELLKAHIGASSAWTFNTDPKVTGQPPDQLAPGTLGVYLYHVTEDSFYKNQPPEGLDPVPVRLTPMALSLYYQISALGEGTSPTDQEQLLISCAAKALHDYPVIDDSTMVPRRAPLTPLNVLRIASLDGADNRLRTSFQPVAYHEASAFWNTSSQVPRLALYYQVSVVLLEPEKPRSVAGRVLQYGVQTLVGGAPRLDGSENTLDVAVPGLTAQSLLIRPAEVPVGGDLVLTGYSLFADATTLLLQHSRWPEPVEVDAAWGVIATEDRVFARVQEFAAGRPVVPGQYVARVKVIRRHKLPGGTAREAPVISNGTPFTISARIDSLTFAADVGTVIGYAFGPPDPAQPPFPPGAVQLCVGGTMLTEAAAGPPLDPGQFQVVSPSEVDFRLPAGLTQAVPASLRVFVMGAESPSQWFTP